MTGLLAALAVALIVMMITGATRPPERRDVWAKAVAVVVLVALGLVAVWVLWRALGVIGFVS
mgnify:FL=1